MKIKQWEVFQDFATRCHCYECDRNHIVLRKPTWFRGNGYARRFLWFGIRRRVEWVKPQSGAWGVATAEEPKEPYAVIRDCEVTIHRTTTDKERLEP